MGRFKGNRIQPIKILGQPQLPDPQELVMRLALLEQIIVDNLLPMMNLSLAIGESDGRVYLIPRPEPQDESADTQLAELEINVEAEPSEGEDSSLSS